MLIILYIISHISVKLNTKRIEPERIDKIIRENLLEKNKINSIIEKHINNVNLDNLYCSKFIENLHIISITVLLFSFANSWAIKQSWIYSFFKLSDKEEKIRVLCLSPLSI